jgi:cell division protein FtsB
MEGIIAVVMIFSVPLIAILTNFYLKLQRMRIEGNRTDQNQDKELELLKKQMGYLMAEQEELRERLQKLEQGPGLKIPESELRQERIDLKNKG